MEKFDDENGVWHCGECQVGIKYWDQSKIILTTINPNTNPKTQKRYPFYANYKKKS